MDSDHAIYSALYKYTRALAVALGYRDQLTRLHSERVVTLSKALGARCDLTERELSILEVGAAFHDIGKIGIPDHILLKTSLLDHDEWATMKLHSEIGQQIMVSTELEGSEEAALIIRHHHEHFDGQGYPDGLSGDSIPLCARIVAIADCYDGMAVTRSYHRARAHPEIVKLLREETGTKHDPELMKLFLDLMERRELKAGSV